MSDGRSWAKDLGLDGWGSGSGVQIPAPLPVDHNIRLTDSHNPPPFPTHPHPRPQLSSYDAHLFNIQGKVSRNMHTQQLGVLQSAFEGLEDAGIPLHEIYRTRTGSCAV